MISIRDSQPPMGTVRVTYLLIIFNLLNFLAIHYGVGPGGMNSFEWEGLIHQMAGVRPLDFSSNPVEVAEGVVRAPALFTLISYQFLHSDWFHLISNMLVLLIFGPNVEVYMGRGRFVLFLITCGVIGAFTHIVLFLDSPKYLIGASGAVSGLFGAYFAIFPRNYMRITLGNIRSQNYRDIMLPVKVILIFWIATQIFDAVLPDPRQMVSIAYLAHLGGFVAGYVLSGEALKMPTIGGRRKFKVFKGGKSGS